MNIQIKIINEKNLTLAKQLIEKTCLKNSKLEKIKFEGPVILELKSREDAVKSLEALRDSGFL